MYKAFSSFLVEYGFYNSKANTSFFIYMKDGKTAYMVIYVDDIILTGNNEEFFMSFILDFSNRFALKDLGSHPYFFGVKVVPTSEGLFLSQH